MTKRNTYKNYKPVLLLLIIFVLMACNKNPQKPDTGKEKELPKLPKVLTELENDTLKVMYDLDSVTGIERAIEKEKSLETKETFGAKTSIELAQQQSDENEKEKDEEGQSEDTEENQSKQAEETVDMQELIVENDIIIPLLETIDISGSFAENTTPPTDIDTVWTEVSDNITEIHKKWNILESELPSERMSMEKTENFEKILDDLTLSVINEEKLNSLKLANELTGVLTNFRNYFDGIGEHDVHEMYYHVRGVILSAAADNYVEAMDHLNKTNKIGDSMRLDLMKKDSEDIFKKFELSMEDLENQLKNRNFHLSQIKAPIVIKNVRLIQDVFETQK